MFLCTNFASLDIKYGKTAEGLLTSMYLRNDFLKLQQHKQILLEDVHAEILRRET